MLSVRRPSTSLGGPPSSLGVLTSQTLVVPSPFHPMRLPPRSVLGCARVGREGGRAGVLTYLRCWKRRAPLCWLLVDVATHHRA